MCKVRPGGTCFSRALSEDASLPANAIPIRSTEDHGLTTNATTVAAASASRMLPIQMAATTILRSECLPFIFTHHFLRLSRLAAAALHSVQENTLELRCIVDLSSEVSRALSGTNCRGEAGGISVCIEKERVLLVRQPSKAVGHSRAARLNTLKASLRRDPGSCREQPAARC